MASRPYFYRISYLDVVVYSSSIYYIFFFWGGGGSYIKRKPPVLVFEDGVLKLSSSFFNIVTFCYFYQCYFYQFYLSHTF